MSTRADKTVRSGSLNEGVPARLDAETFTTLVQAPGVRVERIISQGHASPDGFWYDQAESEYVLLLSGRARLEIEGQSDLELLPGSWVDLPARVRHRVAWTDPHQTTIWLTVFYAPP